MVEEDKETAEEKKEKAASLIKFKAPQNEKEKEKEKENNNEIIKDLNTQAIEQRF